MNGYATRIAENVKRVRERIARAAEDAGRAAEDVSLVAVTKYASAAEIRAVVAAGCRTLGESRPQVLWEKLTEGDLPDVAWHLIGHLQRNKVRRTLPIVSLIHSVDSLRLLKAIDKAAADQSSDKAAADQGADQGSVAQVLLEVNVSGDSEKHGWTADALRRAVAEMADYPHVQVRGLMTMASRMGGEKIARSNFGALRALRDELVAECPENVELTELSMGMSRDFEAAIREGATIVRVGSALFEGAGG